MESRNLLANTTLSETAGFIAGVVGIFLFLIMQPVCVPLEKLAHT